MNKHRNGRRVTEQDKQIIGQLIDNGLKNRDINRLTGWSMDTIQNIRKGTLEQARQASKERQARAKAQNQGLTAPKELLNVESAAPAGAGDILKPIAEFLLDVSDAMIKLAKALTEEVYNGRTD